MKVLHSNSGLPYLLFIALISSPLIYFLYLCLDLSLSVFNQKLFKNRFIVVVDLFRPGHQKILIKPFADGLYKRLRCKMYASI